MVFKVIVSFLVLAVAETLNGIFRIRYLNKKVGKKTAKLFSFLIGLSIVFFLNIVLVQWIEPRNAQEALFIGLFFALGMITYDLYVGKVLFKMSWEKVLDDFNAFKGNLLLFGMISLAVMPYIVFISIID
jgi:hypothetical protein